MNKGTICLWYERDAEAAARFYAKTFPDSSVGAVHRAPADYPDGKAGDALTVEFTVWAYPVSASTADRTTSRVRPSLFRSRPRIRKRPTATGTRSSAMAARKVSAVGARIAGAFPGRSPREF